MITLRELIASSLRLIGINRASNQAYQDAIISLLALSESFSIDKGFYNTIVRSTITIPAGTQSYTLPDTILTLEKAFYISPDALEMEIEDVGIHSYSEISDKTNAAEYPMFYNENGGVLRLYPIPSRDITLVLYSIQTLTIDSDLDSYLNMQPGWIRAMRYNLAVRLAPEYGLEASEQVMKIAMLSKGILSTQYAPDTCQPTAAFINQSEVPDTKLTVSITIAS